MGPPSVCQKSSHQYINGQSTEIVLIANLLDLTIFPGYLRNWANCEIQAAFNDKKTFIRYCFRSVFVAILTLQKEEEVLQIRMIP